MPKYDLDLETLLSLLQDARQTGMLSTELPPGSLGQKARCWVKIKLIEGEVIYCYIESETGVVQAASRNDQKLLQILSDLGSLTWNLDTDGIHADGLPGELSSNNLVRVADSPPFQQQANLLPQPFQQQTGPLPQQRTGPLPPPPFQQRTGPLPPQRTGPLPQQRTGPLPQPPLQQRTGPLPQTQPEGNLRATLPPLWMFSRVPRPVVAVSPMILNGLSRKHRKVLALIDGTRSVEKIATILFSTPQDAWTLLDLLQELEFMGIITMGE